MVKDEKKKKKRDRREKPELKVKVVVRHLPSALPKDKFVVSLLQFQQECSLLSYAVGDPTLGRFAFCTAHLIFRSRPAACAFAEFYDGHGFRNAEGIERRAIVELAPSQRKPKHSRHVDKTVGTIERDPGYLEFLQHMNEQPESVPSVDTWLQELEAKRNANKAVIPTPLTDFLRQKKEQRLREIRRAKDYDRDRPSTDRDRRGKERIKERGKERGRKDRGRDSERPSKARDKPGRAASASAIGGSSSGGDGGGGSSSKYSGHGSSSSSRAGGYSSATSGEPSSQPTKQIVIARRPQETDSSERGSARRVGELSRGSKNAEPAAQPPQPEPQVKIAQRPKLMPTSVTGNSSTNVSSSFTNTNTNTGAATNSKPLRREERQTRPSRPNRIFSQALSESGVASVAVAGKVHGGSGGGGGGGSVGGADGGNSNGGNSSRREAAAEATDDSAGRGGGSSRGRGNSSSSRSRGRGGRGSRGGRGGRGGGDAG